MTRLTRKAQHDALDAFAARYPNKCTREFDGICRCRDERRSYDLRPARTRATRGWEVE